MSCNLVPPGRSLGGQPTPAPAPGRSFAGAEDDRICDGDDPASSSRLHTNDGAFDLMQITSDVDVRPRSRGQPALALGTSYAPPLPKIRTSLPPGVRGVMSAMSMCEHTHVRQDDNQPLETLKKMLPAGRALRPRLRRPPIPRAAPPPPRNL